MRKWALIVGGSSGMGLATAKKLCENNYNLLLIHRDRRSVLDTFNNELSNLRKHGDVIAHNVDGTNKEKLIETLDKFQEAHAGAQFSLFLHAISRGNLKPLIAEEGKALSEQDLHLTMDAMAINVLSWVQRLMSLHLLADKARIITLTSAGSQRYWKGYAAVAMAKSALEILTKYLSIELAKHDFRVNVINAGVTDTPSLRMIPDHEQLITEATARNPYGRMTTPEDVANAIYLLTLPEADWINGNVIDVDGGEHLMG
ncbi:MAG: SDR family oxidoreductase [Cyclobacteriaceae bacterium]